MLEAGEAPSSAPRLTIRNLRNRASVLDCHGIERIEGPVRADDYGGHANVARVARPPIQVGENYWGPHELERLEQPLEVIELRLRPAALGVAAAQLVLDRAGAAGLDPVRHLNVAALQIAL